MLVKASNARARADFRAMRDFARDHCRTQVRSARLLVGSLATDEGMP
jgi:hypothetical protein